MVNYSALFRVGPGSAPQKQDASILTVLGITIGIAAVICVVAIGKAGQARVEQQLNNLGDNFVWIEAGSWAIDQGAIFSQEDTDRAADVCVIGRTVRDQLFGVKDSPCSST